MLSYRLNCRTNTENKNQSVEKTNNDEPMLLSKCEVCDSKKSRFIKEEEANKFPPERDKFMPETHLGQLGFTHNTCG